jgi:hypothetical protein
MSLTRAFACHVDPRLLRYSGRPARDVFDLSQTGSYEGFAAERSLERVEEILRALRTATVMTAVRRLAARPGIAWSGRRNPSPTGRFQHPKESYR